MIFTLGTPDKLFPLEYTSLFHGIERCFPYSEEMILLLASWNLDASSFGFSNMPDIYVFLGHLLTLHYKLRSESVYRLVDLCAAYS